MEMSDDSGSGSDDQYGRMLKKKLAKDNTYGGGKRQRKVDGGLDEDSDLERGNGAGSGEEDEDDWNNFRTGGQVQVEKTDGTTAALAPGKAIPNRRNFGRKN